MLWHRFDKGTLPFKDSKKNILSHNSVLGAPTFLSPSNVVKFWPAMGNLRKDKSCSGSKWSNLKGFLGSVKKIGQLLLKAKSAAGKQLPTTILSYSSINVLFFYV
tara:strand:- start:2587 stop:2901 length:315 start_codon:yes stop_codon:yes gene_type:complete